MSHIRGVPHRELHTRSEAALAWLDRHGATIPPEADKTGGTYGSDFDACMALENACMNVRIAWGYVQKALKGDTRVSVPGIRNLIGDWNGEFETALHYMDGEIIELLNADNDLHGNPQAFVDAYIDKHAEKFDGEQFVIN